MAPLEEEEEVEKSRYYAIRRSEHVSNGIFFSWDDAKSHIQRNDNFPNNANTSKNIIAAPAVAEYGVFDDLSKAVQYLQQFLVSTSTTTSIMMNTSTTSIDPAKQQGATTSSSTDSTTDSDMVVVVRDVEADTRSSTQPSRSAQPDPNTHVSTNYDNELALMMIMNHEDKNNNADHDHDESTARMVPNSSTITSNSNNKNVMFKNSTASSASSNFNLLDPATTTPAATILPITTTTTPTISKEKATSKATAKRPRQETIKSRQKWNDMFNLLKEYHTIYGHVNVSKSDSITAASVATSTATTTVIDTHNNNNNNNNNNNTTTNSNYKELYKWICQQRTEYKKLRNNKNTKITASRIQKLNDLGFVFNPRSNYMRWEERIDQLREYKHKHGHLRVSVTDPDIGEFVARQRVEYVKFQNGKSTNMTERRMEDLTNLGFVFQAGKRRITSDGVHQKIIRKSWDERFHELLQYKEVNGHTLVPQNNSALGYV
jgi:hypothetical protein